VRDKKEEVADRGKREGEIRGRRKVGWATQGRKTYLGSRLGIDKRAFTVTCDPTT
jgi:hypothetical protein